MTCLKFTQSSAKWIPKNKYTTQSAIKTKSQLNCCTSFIRSRLDWHHSILILFNNWTLLQTFTIAILVELCCIWDMRCQDKIGSLLSLLRAEIVHLISIIIDNLDRGVVMRELKSIAILVIAQISFSGYTTEWLELGVVTHLCKLISTTCLLC